MREEWVSPWWQAMVLPDTWECCGITVPPLSVWHVFALSNIGNRYLCGGHCTTDDAASLLLFARHDLRSGRRLMNPAATRYRESETAKVLKSLTRLPEDEIRAACTEYVETCTRAASRWRKETAASKPAGVPHEFHLVRAVAMITGDIEAAWNMPYAEARGYFDAYAESKGDDSIMSPQAQEMEDNWDHYKDDDADANDMQEGA